ncbi:AI-2E family transporter [Rhodopseudomonas palustris]|uniref:AI-2E family transporter n=1 Tax=Rhodopseudomonas palustris TaxID=1076 RepID=A0A418VP20_RHOPL|nr:AI-2E family transporter [Rhodopseudomonas palustris]RJF77957.1 AI-2E family transporter [Rhodopseudomonas palustris]
MRIVPVEPAGTPLPDSTEERPPLIRRTEVVAFALVALLIIVGTGLLYVAKPFFLPIVTAFVVGTMLSPAATFLERWRLPRPVCAVVIVGLALTTVGFMVALISAPVVEWSGRLPELGGLLKEKLSFLEKPMGFWRQLQTSIGGSESTASTPIQMPQIDWMQPTLEFVSPTITEFLLFLVTLVLFVASWKDLRRALVMNFGDRDARLRTLRILNEIEMSLGGYLLTVTTINLCYGAATGVICALAGMPNPAALGALAAILNFIPIIGPSVMFIILALVGVVAMPTLGEALIGPLGFALLTFVEGHFITPTIIGRRLELNALAVFVALAFWTWLWGPMGGFLASPLLIVGLVVKEHLMPADAPHLPGTKDTE